MPTDLKDLTSALPLRLSDTGLNLLKRFEGYRSHTYIDAAGMPTIGYGHRLLAGESFPNGLTEAQAQALLAADVRAAELAVCRLVKAPLNQGQFDALVDFVFNLGAGRLAGSTLLKDLNAGSYETAGEQILRWDHTGAEVNAGLKVRREAEFELWQAGEARRENAA